MKSIAISLLLICVAAPALSQQPHLASVEFYVNFVHYNQTGSVYVEANLDQSAPAYGINTSTNQIDTITSFSDAVHESDGNLKGWDSPDSQNYSTKYLPWGVVNFVVHYNNGDPLHFSIDFSDQKWVNDPAYGDTRLNVDSVSRTCTLSGTGRDTVQLSDYGSYIIYVFWGVSETPRVPQNLAITNTTSTPVHLAWDKNVAWVWGYPVYRKVINGDNTWHQIATATTNSYTDNDYVWFSMGGNFSLVYEVRAEDVFTNYSGYSNTASCTADENGTRLKAPELTNDSEQFQNRLQCNYPNPFNPATRIDYELKAASHVTLKVYSILGQEVATLVDADMPRGRFSARFDGSHMASGIYICRLRIGEFQDTKQLVLAK